MKNTTQHAVDFLFSIALFFVFSATALVVLLLSANIYRNVVADSEQNFETGTALSYITEKIHQNDAGGSEHIFLTTFDGCDALAISQEYHGTTYITYIYELNGELKETFIQEGVTASASAGTTIMNIGALELTSVSDTLLRVTCTPADGLPASTLIHIHSD